jgi:hypothetical protein
MSDKIYSDSDKQRAFDLTMMVVDSGKNLISKDIQFKSLSRIDQIDAFAKLYAKSLLALSDQSLHTDKENQQ